MNMFVFHFERKFTFNISYLELDALSVFKFEGGTNNQFHYVIFLN